MLQHHICKRQAVHSNVSQSGTPLQCGYCSQQFLVLPISLLPFQGGEFCPYTELTPESQQPRVADVSLTCVAGDGREVRVQQVQVSLWALLQSLPASEVWAAVGGSQRADGGRHLAVPSLL